MGLRNIYPVSNKVFHDLLLDCAHVTPLESSRVCYCLRGAKKGVAVAAGGVAGLLRLRWPQGCREGAETAGLRPCGTGRLGPSRSRGRCPGGEGEAEAATRRNKSSRTRLCPCAASLRRLGWVRGGCAPVVEPLYRRCSLPATHRPSVEVSSSAFCLVDTEHTSGLVESRRVEQIHASRGGSGRRRQIWLQGHRGSGCVPGRWSSRGGFRSSLVAVVLCGPFQSFIAMGFRLAMGSRRSILAAAAVRRRRNLEHIGSRDLVVFSHFLWTFVQFVWWCRCPMYPAKMYMYLYCYLYRIF